MKTESFFEQRIFSWVAEMIGKDVTELNRDMNLDADLAMDSIKMMGLMSHISRKMEEENSSISSEVIKANTFVRFQTLGDIVDFLSRERSEAQQTDQTQASRNPLVQPETPETNTPVVCDTESGETVEILNSQYVFIIAHYIASTSGICHSFRLKGPFDVSRAHFCWQALIDRHPILRTRFIIPDDADSFKDYQSWLLQKPVAPSIEITDISDFPTDKKEQCVLDEFDRLLNSKWNLREWPLHRFSLLRLAEDEYELYLSSDHVVSDGLGDQRLMREFMELYRAEETGDDPQLPAAVSSEQYWEIVNKINSYYDESEEAFLKQYLEKQGRSTFFWNPEGSDLSSLSSVYKNRVYRLDKETTSVLLRRTSDWRLPLNSILVSAYLKTLSRFTPEKNDEPIILQIPTSGKVYPGVEAFDLLGPFAQNMALSFNPTSEQETWSELLYRVQDEIKQAMMSGLDRAQTRHLADMIKQSFVIENGKLPDWVTSMFHFSVKSNLYFPYTGNTHIHKQYGSLEVVSYKAGTYNRAGTLDLQQELFDGSLHIFMNFDSGFFSEAVIAEMAGEYIKQLRTLASLEIPFQSSVTAVPPPVEEGIEETLGQIAGKVLGMRITPDDMKRDLEGDLGGDSLERIRIITKILSTSRREVNKNDLFSARSLWDMAVILSASNTGTASTDIMPEHNAVADADRDSAGDGAKTNRALNTGFPFDKTLPAVPCLHISRQAVLNPQSAAVISGDKSLSYGELESLSNQLAHHLLALGTTKGQLLGLMASRGPGMIIGMLGILKAGAAYVPIDPQFPAKRVQSILTQARVALLLTEWALAPELKNCLSDALPLKSLVFLDENSSAHPEGIGQSWTQTLRSDWLSCSADFPAVELDPDELMAVMFTSGSTGTPKGIATNHRSYMNRLTWHQNTFQLKPGERVSQNTSCSFDISIREIFWPLMVGGSVCPVEAEVVSNPWRLAAWLQDNEIQVYQFVPSLFGEFVHVMEHENWVFPHLRWLLFSTEPLPVSLVRAWIDRYGMSIGIANQYGPSECAIESTCHIIQKRPGDDVKRISIGKPIDNVFILLLNDKGEPVAKGEIGEVYIGGVQVSRGYLYDEKRTGEVFIENKFSHVPGAYIYKTGDLARELADGSYEFHGRCDNQVKIRGFRVELGEVEAVLLAHAGIREAAVLAVDIEGRKKLVAWLVGEAQEDNTVKKHVADRLPDYMVPHQIRWLDKLPRNHNRKLDRKRLRDDFSRELNSVSGDCGTANGEYAGNQEYLLPLGPAQRWLLSYFEPPYQWWGSVRYIFKQPLDIDLFIKAFNHIIARHSALRTIFLCKEGTWFQKILPEVESFQPECYDGSHLSPEQRNVSIRAMSERFVQELKIDSWPLIRMGIVKCSPNAYEFCMVAHHLLADMLSGQIIFRDLWETYSEMLAGFSEAIDVNPVVAYADQVIYLDARDKAGLLDGHVEYWQSCFPSPEDRFEFPADHILGENIESSSGMETFELSLEMTDYLLRHARGAFGTSLYSVLLAPWYRELAYWSDSETVILSHRMNGRDIGEGPLTYAESVGDFAVNFPVRLSIKGEEEWLELVKKVRQAFDELPMNGVTYDWIADRLPAHAYPDNKLTPIRINYLGHASVSSSELFEIDWDEANQRFMPATQKRICKIEVFMLIRDKRLHVEISYSRNFYLRDTIRKLGNCYLEAIREMVREISSMNDLSIKNKYT